MIVWRVETEHHGGPFQTDRDFTGLSRAILSNGQKIWDFPEHSHPSYQLDFRGQGYVSGAYFFGCPSLKDLKSWFGYKNVIEYLKKHDFHISKYEVDSRGVVFGKSGIQCTFDIIVATSLCHLPIDELLSENAL